MQILPGGRDTSNLEKIHSTMKEPLSQMASLIRKLNLDETQSSLITDVKLKNITKKSFTALKIMGFLMTIGITG